MEEINVITTLISSVGFPIACCCVLFYLFYQMRETLDKLNTTLVTLDIRLQEIENDMKELKSGID